jgi:hypothetical protein
MEYRRDGWISASPINRNCTFITKKIMAGGKLAINASTAKDGFIRVELLDANGNELADYSGANAAMFTGDSISKVLSWKDGTLFSPPSTVFKVKVTIEQGDLFAMEF